MNVAEYIVKTFRFEIRNAPSELNLTPFQNINLKTLEEQSFYCIMQGPLEKLIEHSIKTCMFVAFPLRVDSRRTLF